MIYDLRLINDYINGNDIEGYTLEELENDPSFMESAIRVTNDKKLYDLCSVEVKNNFDFVCFLIDKFSDDIEFIDKVASVFLGNCIDKDLSLTIIVKMCNLLEPYGDNDIFGKYRVMFMGRFYTEIVCIEQYKIDNPDDNEIGLGFMLFYDEYKYNPEIIDYYAKEFINYFLGEPFGLDLESTIHKEFKYPNEINNYGIKKYMIDLISKYDYNLADYAAINPEILNSFQKKINKIQSKWNKYIDSEEAYTYELMFGKVRDYMDDEAFDSAFSEDDYLYFIGKELGLSEKLAKYSNLSLEIYEKKNESVNEDFIISVLNNKREKAIYLGIKKIMIDSLFNNSNSNDDGKIIRLNFKKSKE